MTFTDSPNCTSRFNCAAYCLVNPEWRKMFDAPDVCPFGVTLENHTAILKESIAKHSAPVPAPLTNQPGDILAKLIHTFTGETPCGACDARRKQMNEWSWTGCVVHIKEIAGWIEEEAQKRGKTLDPATVISTIWKAVKVGLKVEKEMLTKPIESSTDTNSETPSPAISQGAR